MVKILDTDNTVFDIDTVPDEIDDVRFCVLDGSNAEDVDFYFLPLVFLESFHAPSVCLQIGNYQIQVPLDWSILVSDYERTELEIIPLTSLNNRGFRVILTNPLESGFPVSTEEIEIVNIYQDVKWHFPKLKNGHMLVLPLEDTASPKCIIVVKDANKVCPLDYGQIA